MHVYTTRAKITLNLARQHKLPQKLRGEHPLRTAVALVEELTVSEATVIPAPKLAAVVPCTHFVN